ncbi:MAG: pilus assembly protein TadG-related protein [Desulfurivibrionaceae bacterium]
MKTITSGSEQGAVAPLVAILIVLFILCIALVVDLGHLHNVKVQLQRAVDAAALAGARQLDGTTGQDDRAGYVARAAADINKIDSNSGWVTNAYEFEITPGIWDKDLAADPRFTPVTEESVVMANAIKVKATLQVDNIFFFLTDNSTVSADAIAVANPDVPVIPLAIVTCVPADEMLENPGSLPGLTACDITSYNLDNDQDDTMAFTSLTFGANANDIVEYMSTEEGLEKFNKVIFGKGLTTTDGIENESVDLGGCYPHDLDIPCGLGRISSEDLAPPEAFPVPESISPLNSTPGEPAVGFDPMIAYGANGALPRWYHNNDDESFGDDDHFTRVWSQDGILLPGAGENTQEFVVRLKTYAECGEDDLSCRPYNDDRFLDGNLVIKPPNQLAKNLEETLGFAPEYWPDYREVINRAGYPKIGIINGTVSTVLSAFIDNKNVSDGTDLICSDNDPFPPGQTTLRLNAPVIFAGACEDWKAISNPSAEHTLTYIGLSKLLLTRAWIKESYDCGELSEVVQLPAGGCPDKVFDPALNGSYFSADGVPVPSSFRGLEGLSMVPVADDEEDSGSMLNVFLVE